MSKDEQSKRGERVQLTQRMPSALYKKVLELNKMLREQDTDISLQGRHSINDTINIVISRGVDIVNKQYASKTSALKTQTVARLKSRIKALTTRCLDAEAQNKVLLKTLEESEARQSECEDDLVWERSRHQEIKDDLYATTQQLLSAKDRLRNQRARLETFAVFVIDGRTSARLVCLPFSAIVSKRGFLGFIDQDGHFNRLHTDVRKALNDLGVAEPSLWGKISKVVFDPRPPLLPSK